MDYTKQIFEMLGVKPEEEFKTQHRIYNSDQQLYKIDQKLNVFGFYNAEWIELDETHLLQMLLNGDAKIIKIPHPTAEEQLAIDYARVCGHKWLAKDEDDMVFAYSEKPEKSFVNWRSSVIGSGFMEIRIPISFLSWEDKEPFYMGDLQKETEVKQVCEHYSEGKCMARIYHPNVVCEGNKNRCYTG